MQNIPDHKLDDLFREKSENARIAFNPQAWEKMDKKLAEAEVRKAILKRWIFFSSFFFLMLLTPFVWNYLDDHKNDVYASAVLRAEGNNGNKISLSSQGSDKADSNAKVLETPDLPKDERFASGIEDEASKSELSNKKSTARLDSEKSSFKASESLEDKGSNPIITNKSEKETKKQNEENERLTDAKSKNGIIRPAPVLINSGETISNSNHDKKAESNLEARTTEEKSRDNKKRDPERTKNFSANNSLKQKATVESTNQSGDKASASIEETSLSENVSIKKTAEVNRDQNVKGFSRGINQSTDKITKKTDSKSKKPEQKEMENEFQNLNGVHGELIDYMNSKGAHQGFNIQPLLASLTFDSEYYSLRLSPTTSQQDAKWEKSENISFQSKLRISGHFSPDFSSVIKIELNRPSYNTGFSFEYFLSDKFSFSLGMLNSRKVYTAKPDAYSFSYPVYHTPDRIEGKCTVYDVPLNVKYYYASGRRFRNFVSTGISSYIMRKESYTLEYSNYTKTYDYPKGHNHLFSVVNISVGGEFQVTPRFSVGLEPFMKIPTKGVGQGKIKLNTVGSFLSINYTIYKK